VPTKPPHHVSSQESQSPHPRPICRTPKMRNEPNSPVPLASRRLSHTQCPKNTKRTQLPPSRQPPQPPIEARRRSRRESTRRRRACGGLSKTNPIYPPRPRCRPRPKYAKRTQFPPAMEGRRQICRCDHGPIAFWAGSNKIGKTIQDKEK
jgi:hypothetical protein